ncbi:hypothetical protein DXT91_10875 [Agrobacterium tumefaciens]|nr:hypothetical protein [Agrobacterium tumefaciens]
MGQVRAGRPNPAGSYLGYRFEFSFGHDWPEEERATLQVKQGAEDDSGIVRRPLEKEQYSP